MEVLYANTRLATTMSREKDMVRAYGAVRARRIQLRLQQLRVAETLAEARQLTGRVHELTGDLRGVVAMDLDGPYRLLLRPVDERGEIMPPPVDWDAARCVVIDGVRDYH
jgi:proteic killer suppression protein